MGGCCNEPEERKQKELRSAPCFYLGTHVQLHGEEGLHGEEVLHGEEGVLETALLHYHYHSLTWYDPWLPNQQVSLAGLMALQEF